MTEKNSQVLAEELGVPPSSVPASYKPRYNLAPMQEHFIVRLRREERELLVARWGLVNRWAKDNRDAAKRINARAETIDTSGVFRDAFKLRRCVVPCDGYYEWTGPKTARQPLWFHRPYGGLLLLAGLYESWQREPGLWETTFTVITTGANQLAAAIHDRMPAILLPDNVDAWLDERNPDLAGLKRLLAPAPAELLVATPASPLVNNVANDSAECLGDHAR